MRECEVYEVSASARVLFCVARCCRFSSAALPASTFVVASWFEKSLAEEERGGEYSGRLSRDMAVSEPCHVVLFIPTPEAI